MVKSWLGQKQLASLLEVHLGTRVSQVLRHRGTTLGQGEVGVLEGAETGAIEVDPEHLVQIVDVSVTTTVERVVVGTVSVEPPEVIVLVTGHLVTVV